MPRTVLLISLFALLLAAACNSDTYTEESDLREPMSEDREPMNEAPEPMNRTSDKNQPSVATGSSSGTQVAILDHGFQMTRGTQVIPNGWKLTQDIATDPNTAQSARFDLEIRGPGGELIKALGVSQYTELMGTSFEQALHQMTKRGLAGEVQDVSIGNLQRSATLEGSAEFQKAMQHGRHEGSGCRAWKHRSKELATATLFPGSCTWDISRRPVGRAREPSRVRLSSLVPMVWSIRFG